MRPVEWGDAEPIWITRRPDGKLVADAFPQVTVVTELLADAVPTLVHISGDLITVTAVNGRAVYEIVERAPQGTLATRRDVHLVRDSG